MDTKETRIFIALLIGLLILSLFFAFFIVTLVRSHKRKLVIEQQQILEQMTSLEAERARIARDLHDSFSALLATAKVHLQCMEFVHPADAICLAKASENIDMIQEKVRDISMKLTPQILERKGLIAAIKDLVEGIHSSHVMRIKVIAEQPTYPFRKDTAIHIYRIVQEMITNALKHAHATEMCIEVRQERKWIVVNISDNGVGFKVPEPTKAWVGFGLQTISSRVSLLQGRIQLDTKLGKGTHYMIELPIKTP